MTALLLPQSLPELRILADRALAWWLGELAGLLPDKVRGALLSRGREVVVELGRGHIKLVGRSLGDTEAGIVLDRSKLDQAAPSLIDRIVGRVARIDVAYDLVLRAELELPAGAEGRMRMVLRHQLERIVPLRPESVEYTWQVVERIPARKALRVVIAVVKASTLRDAEIMCRELGLRLRAITVLGFGAGTPALWVSRTTGERERQHGMSRALDAAIAACLLVSYGLILIRQDAQSDALRAELSSATVQNVKYRLAARQTNTVEAKLDWIDRRLAEPTPLAVLEALTKATPLDTSISQFHFKGGKIEITGASQHAVSMLPAIESAALFKAPAFTAPITSGGGSNAEHFAMSFQVSR